jgi:hypothetical protein
MACGAAEVLLAIDPDNKVGRDCLSRREETRVPIEKMSKEELLEVERKVEEGYRDVMFHANVLKVELDSPSFRNVVDDPEKALLKLHALSKGNIASALSLTRPVSVQEAAKEIVLKPEIAIDALFADMECIVRWMTYQVCDLDTAKLRQKLIKRRVLFESALPDSMQQDIAAAFRLIEREYLQMKYMNEDGETMLGEKIEAIPRAQFFVSEDNWAFDMEELVMAIEANSGVMRNPLSRQMFSNADILTILGHPLGKRLKPLEEDQSRWRKGIRPTTIAKIDELGRTMLTDQSMDGGPTRIAIDEFLAFMVTVPSSEQQTIKRLKIPAVDKNTGQPFDYSIAESVTDAKAGTTCYHKVMTYV